MTRTITLQLKCALPTSELFFSVTQSGTSISHSYTYMHFQLSISLIPSSHSQTLRISGRQSHMTTPAIIISVQMSDYKLRSMPPEILSPVCNFNLIDERVVVLRENVSNILWLEEETMWPDLLTKQPSCIVLLQFILHYFNPSCLMWLPPPHASCTPKAHSSIQRTS